MRWGLMLQGYNLSIKHIKCKDNFIANVYDVMLSTTTKILINKVIYHIYYIYITSPLLKYF
jgi:hypothetical protein